MKSAKSFGQNILPKKLKQYSEIQRTNSQNFNYLLEFTTPRTQQQNILNTKFDNNSSFKKNPLQTSYYGSTKQSSDFKQFSNLTHSKQKVTKELIEKLLKDDSQTPKAIQKINKVNLNAALANLQKSKKQNLSKKQFFDQKSPNNMKIAKRRTSKQQQQVAKQNLTKSTQSSSKQNQKFSINLANNTQKHKQQNSFTSTNFHELFTQNQITGIKKIVQNELKQFLTLQKIKSLEESQKTQVLDNKSQQFYDNLIKQMQVFEANDLEKQVSPNSLFSPYFLHQISSQKTAQQTQQQTQGTNFRAKLKNLINYGKKKQNFYSPKLYQSQCTMQHQMNKIIERMKNVFSSFEQEKIVRINEKKQIQSVQVRQTPRIIEEKADKN